MHDAILTIIDRLGYLGIAILMALENIFPPLPSEAIMGAGALSMENGGMQFWPLLIAGTLGTLAITCGTGSGCGLDTSGLGRLSTAGGAG